MTLKTALHFISDPEVAKADLPRFLRHEPPSTASSGDIGSKDYSRPPEAFVLGLGYTNDVVDEFRKACEGVGKGVPWVVGGLSKDEFRSLVDAKSLGPPEQHGPRAAEMQKRKVLEVLSEGKGGKDGMFAWYEG